MPELPEVETIRRSLLIIEKKKISGLGLSSLAPIETTTAAEIRNNLKEAVLTMPERQGKYLLLRTEKGAALVVHLGMSGRVRYYPRGLPKSIPHRHLWLNFSDGSALDFVDPRRFGTLSLTFQPDGSDNEFLKRLGPDYIDPRFTEQEFIQRCRRHPGLTLKSLALHQGIAAGLGNIYACEALYRANLHPKRKVGKTSERRLAVFFHSAREALQIGIKHGGSSLRDYMDGLGNRGVMKQFLLVYDRENQSSLDGRGMVKRIVQQGRSTWFCPTVQK